MVSGSACLVQAMGVMESSKLTTLLKQLRIRSMSDRERLEMVAMFAPFALFTCKQISHVTQTFSIGAERIAAATLLFTRAADTATDMVSLTSSMSSYDLLGWKDVLGWYNTYRWNVPTGESVPWSRILNAQMSFQLEVCAAAAAGTGKARKQQGR